MHYHCPAGTFRKIQQNESIADIATQYSLSSHELLAKNAYLNPIYYLSGQVIVIPCGNDNNSYGIYTVSKNETLCDVLRRADISAAELIRFNPHTDIFDLHEGDRLNIPLREVEAGEFHTIEDNETINTLSQRYNVSPIVLLRMNPNLRPSEFTSGQTIRVSNT